MSAPSDDEREARAERIVTRHLSRLSKQSGWAEDDTAIGGQAANIVRQLAEAGILRRSEVPETNKAPITPCSCPCHTTPGYSHIAACCTPVEPQGEPSDALALWERPAAIEAARLAYQEAYEANYDADDCIAFALRAAASVVECDYCGESLPNVKRRADVPTTPDLQRMGFDAAKVVCPQCVSRVRAAGGVR